tara:strand:+ start:2867 stop:14401 length:11535 start_codon:yes stop_codon:yes gene_type:complete
MASRIYKLELRNPETDEKVDFGQRRLGDVGRDILIVKRALGTIVTYASLLEADDDNPSLEDPQGWFDCSSGMKVSNIEAATFDSNMQTYLTKFQLDNQFYILCYLFTKFGINQSFEDLNSVDQRPFAGSPDLETRLNRSPLHRRPSGFNTTEISEYMQSNYAATQIELINRMFQDEFGKLGEATLAVLHGWRPRTRVGNNTYHHDPVVFADESGAYDLALLGLYDSFTQGFLTQKVENTPDLLEPRQNFQSYLGNKPQGLVFLENYKSQVAESERLNFNTDSSEYVIKSSYFGGLRYRIVSPDNNSPLYDAFIEISNEYPRPREVSLMSDSDFSETLFRAFEPDPLIDPDPFIIDSSRIGFFDKTEYTLSNLPPFLRENPSPQDLQSYQEAILLLEDQALTKVLEFYNKPQAWFHNPLDGRFQALYGYDMEITPNHDGTYRSQSDFVLSTNVSIEEYDLIARAENWSTIEGDDIESPLIKFIEFRTPSLRPGDKYRAKFEINRKKLEYITDGVEFEDEADQEIAPLPEAWASEEIEIAESCEQQPVSKGEQERRYQEYKALAKKRKQEIARTIREKTLENYNNNQSLDRASINLGVFGNTNIDLGQNSYEYTNTVLNAASGLVTSAGTTAGVTSPKLSDFKKLQVTFADLEELITNSADNLKKAQENCETEGVSIQPLTFNANTESSKLKTIPAQLKNFVKKKNKKFDFGANSKGNMKLSGFAGTESTLDFQFAPSPAGTGLVVSSLSAGGKSLSVDELTTSVPALRSPRTVSYLAQSRVMGDTIGFLGFRSLECEKIGIGKLGLSFIIKHTVGISGESDNEFNPINQWAKNNIEDPRKRWEQFKKKNDLSAKLKIKFGEDDILSVFADQCSSLKELLQGVANIISPGAILCKLIQCLKLPAFDVKIPDFNLNFNIDLAIWGWYRDLIKNLLKQWEEILTQFLCVFVKALLDILNAPLCQEQLRDQLYGSGAGSTGDIKRALIDGLTDLSISPENIEKTKQLIDEMALFLTGEELCRVLEGGEVDAATMHMILTLAENLGIDEVGLEQNLRELFETIAVFLPPNFCDNLRESSTVIGSATCAETSSLLDQIRRQMLTSGASDEDIKNAVDLANKNLLDQAKAIEALGEKGLNAIVPKILEFGNPDALINKLPDALSQQINNTAKSLFNSAHIGYVGSLSNFGPSLFLQSSRLPKPSDPEYNEESTIIVQTILENLKLYGAIGNERNSPNIESATEQLHVLYQIYELSRDPVSGVMVPAYYMQPDGQTIQVPQDAVRSYPRLTDIELQSEVDFEKLFLNPVGFRQNSFYDVDENENIVSMDNSLKINNRSVRVINATRRQMRLPLSSKESFGMFGLPVGEDSLLIDFSFIGSYKIVEKAEDDETVTPEEGRLQFLLERIQNRLTFLQNTLQVHLQNISNPINEEDYLKIIKTALDFSYENSRERLRSTNNPELINVEPGRQDGNDRGTARQRLSLNLNLGPIVSNIELNEFASTENTNRFDPYTIIINNSPLFSGPQTFEYCDKIPGPGLNEETLTQEQAENRDMFEQAIADIPPGLYTRKELFARSFWENVKRKVNFIYRRERPDENADRQVATLQNYLNNFLRQHVYDREAPNFTEGVFEQIFFSLRDSRIYDEQNYYEELKRRVSGEAYFSENDDCYKNRYNVSQFGILSFEKMVTDELANEIAKEINKPENDPYVLDFDDLGPVQKAIQNVCLLGFVRVCIVELMLKGSLAYSVWDVEGVADEPFMKDFVYRFVREEIDRHPSLQGKWEKVITRMTGIDQSTFALKDLVQKQMIRVQGASKKVFQNGDNIDYFNWFIRYFVPQVEVSRDIANRDDVALIRGVDALSLGDEGQIEGQVRIDAEIPDKFYWQHPLLNERNLIQDESSGTIDVIKRASDLLSGNNPFFHIEHLLEVTGPLARLESLILPGRQVINSIINADASDPEDNDLTTIVMPILNLSRRSPERLNIADAYLRTNLPAINIDNYDFRNTPELPEGARGSSAEGQGDLNEEHEIYHIDDFIDGLNSVMNSDNVEKIFLHYRGLMHYDESPDPPGGRDRNTTVPAANARPEVIRRTPTRFITRKRRIVHFSQDFLTSRNPAISSGEAAAYITRLFNNPTFLGEDEYSTQKFDQFGDLVSISDEIVKYHIVPSNGEELLALQASGESIDITEDNRFRLYNASSNGMAVDNSHGDYVDHVFRDAGRDADDLPYTTIGAIRYDTGRGLFPNFGRGLKKDLEIENIEGDQSPYNILSVDRSFNPLVSEKIFDNPLGTVLPNQNQSELESFNSIKSGYENPHEETWVETVFNFTDTASVIAGLHGSFTIGETFDNAVSKFEPTRNTKRAFEDRLRPVIDRLSTIAGRPERGYDNAFVRDTRDKKLTQYGRTIFLREAEGLASSDVYLARPMGIDRFTNVEMTTDWLIPSIEEIRRVQPAELLDFSFLANREQRDRRDSLKLVIDHDPERIRQGLSPRAENLLPPNFYKIPIRVLITQVYDSNSDFAREVFCKVVPPKYIRSIHDDSLLQENIDKLNVALQNIVDEYVQYVNNHDRFEVQEEVPEFTTDFSRRHTRARNESNIDRQSLPQYCSIERIYSRVFQDEVTAPEFNTSDDLDLLFQDRGSLMINRAATIPLNTVDLDQEQFKQNLIRDWHHRQESCNYMYFISKDENLLSNKNAFHRTVFSLRNIFQWYLRTRRTNTLWGLLTNKGNNKETGRQQLIPLAHSFGLAQRGARARRDAQFGARNTDRISWASTVLPRKRWDNYVGDFDEELDGARADRGYLDLEDQPGLVTLYPGDDDVDSILEEGLSGDSDGLRRINKQDYTSWNFYGEGELLAHLDRGDRASIAGLVSDGEGRNLINYNSIEHCPVKNTGTSLFYSEGIISQMDISDFLKSLVYDVVFRSYRSNLTPPARDDVTSLFDIDSFFSINDSANVQVMSLLVESSTFVVEDGEVQERAPFQFPGQLFNLSPDFSPSAINLDDELVNSMIIAASHIITRLFDLTSSQAAFSVKSEVTKYNSDILEAPYRLAILERILRKAKDGNYTSLEKIFLVAVASIYDLPATIVRIKEEAAGRTLNGEAQQAQNFDDVQDDEALIPWAAACIHYVAKAHQRSDEGDDYIVDNYTDLVDTYSESRRGRRYFINANRSWVRDLGPPGADIGGNRNDPASVKWERTKNLVRNAEITVKQIIKRTNALYYDLVQREEWPIRIDILQDNATGNEYVHNTRILNKILDPDWNDSPTVEEFGAFYSNAISLANIAAFGSNAQLNVSAPRLLQTIGFNESLARALQSKNKIENFLCKLDYRTFQQILGKDSGPFVLNQNVQYIENYIREQTGISLAQPQDNTDRTLFGDFYQQVAPLLVYNSDYYRSARNKIQNFTIESHFSNVETIASRWNYAYQLNTGITPRVLGEAVLNRALINGQVFEGLLQSSEINQVSRLVANTFIKERDFVRGDQLAFNEFVQNPNGPIQEISEEFRSFYMFGNRNQKIFSVPMAEYKKPISPFGEALDDCYDLSRFREGYILLQPWMTEQLIETQEAKQIFEYIYPVKRFQSIATAFSTSVLAGYSTMPSIMQTPKASLAALLGLAGIKRTEESNVIQSISQAEFYKQMTDSAVSDPKELSCFGFPFPEDFLDQFLELLEQLFKTFPSIFFRGIANAIDPAYQEMKNHWDNCDIDKLTWSGYQWKSTVGTRTMHAGLVGESGGGNRDKKYASVLTSPLVDLPVGFSKAIYGNWTPLRRAVTRLSGYIIKGPTAIIDQAFSFSIPCLDEAGQWPGEPLPSWNRDRYGHPISPITAIALSLPELPGDKRLRTCRDDPYDPERMEEKLCPNSDIELPPFGNTTEIDEE